MGFWVSWIVVVLLKEVNAMRSVLPIMLVAVFGLLAQAADNQVPGGEKRPMKIWDRTGPLGETPTRTTDAFPLSDQ
jgi:hypothetical protein